MNHLWKFGNAQMYYQEKCWHNKISAFQSLYIPNIADQKSAARNNNVARLQ